MPGFMLFPYRIFLIVDGGTAESIANAYGTEGIMITFVDVPSNYWAKDQIDYFAQQGIIDGYEDGSFKPEAGVTRAEFCKLLVSTFKQPLDTPNTPTFSDVPENHWSYPYVEVCREFLTGYANPFGGLPTFQPIAYATREDIAVALVRMMGFTDSDANNPNYAAYNFRDGGNISPNLLAYVSIAVEKGLISGYPDGTFGPTQGITRAETVVLLNRATKQAVTNINAELEMTANVLYSEYGKTATINIVAEEGTTVTVNGETVKMSSNYYDEYEGNFVYKFEQEGSKDFTIEGKRGGKTKAISLTAKYEIGVPVLKITSCPTSVTTKNITISGTMYDSNYSSSLTVNGKTIASNSYNDYEKSWNESFELEEGINVFEFVLTNSAGKSVTEKKTVNFLVGEPEIKFINCPENTKKNSITIKGKIAGNKEGAMLFIDDEEVYVNYSGEFSETFDLKEGSNIVVTTYMKVILKK